MIMTGDLMWETKFVFLIFSNQSSRIKESKSQLFFFKKYITMYKLYGMVTYCPIVQLIRKFETNFHYLFFFVPYFAVTQ